MHPRLDLGSISVGSFLVLIVVGTLVGLAVFGRLAREFQLPRRHVWALVLGTVLAGLMGSHWLHVWATWDYHRHHPFQAAFGFWGGRAFLGGPIGGSLFVLAYVWWHRLPGWKVFDAIAPGLALGQVFGRIGCFAGGCCYGCPTDSSLGIALTQVHLDPPEWTGLPLHPVQLYEAAGLLVLFHALLWLHRRRGFDGRVVLGYWLGYGALRFGLEFLRGDPIRGFVLNGLLSVSQLITLLAFSGAAILLLRRSRQTEAGLLVRLREDAGLRQRWLWAGLAGIALVVQGPGLLDMLVPEPTPDQGQRDFYQEWASARNFHEGLPVYTPHAVSLPRYHGVEVDPDSPYQIEVNAHPPTSVLLALPLAGMEQPTAHLCWNLASLLALAAATALIVRQLGMSRWSLFPIAVLLSGEPLREHLAQGQFGCFLVLLLALCWQANRAGRERSAGAWLALATALKLFPGFLFVYFLARRQWRVVGHGLLWLLLIFLATGLVLGPTTCIDYVTQVVPRVNEWRSQWAINSLPGLWAKLFHPGNRAEPAPPLIYSPLLASLATLLSGGLMTLLTVRQARAARTMQEQEGAFGLALIATVMLSPVSWNHYFFLMFFALCWLWPRLESEGSQRTLFGAILAILWISAQTFWTHLGPAWGEHLTLRHTLTISSFQLYALFALFGMHLAVLRRPQAGLRLLTEGIRRPDVNGRIAA